MLLGRLMLYAISSIESSKWIKWLIPLPLLLLQT